MMMTARQREGRQLLGTFLLIVGLGVAAAAVVTALTGSAPVRLDVRAWAPGQLEGFAKCSATDVDRRNAEPACDVIQFRHPGFAGAHVVPMDPALFGFDPEHGVLLGSSWITYPELGPLAQRSGLTWEYVPEPERPANLGRGSSGDSSEGFGQLEIVESFRNSEGVLEALGTDGSRLRNPVIVDWLEAQGVGNLNLEVEKFVEGGAPQTVGWDIGDVVVTDPDVIGIDDITEVRLSWDEWTTEWATTGQNERPRQVRSLGLGVIWGTAGGLLTLVGLVGAYVAWRGLRVAAEADHARTRAERQASRLRTLTHGMSHEVRSPIRAMAAAAERLGNPDTPKKRHPRLLEQISAGANEARTTLDALVSMADANDLELTEVALAPLVDEVLDRARQERPAVAYRREGTGGTVLANAAGVSRIIANLVANGATHNTTADAPMVLVTVGESTISVQDNGPGIPLSKRELVFDLGARLDVETVGTGTGLAIVKTLAEAMGATVVVKDNIGKGVTFTVRFTP